MKYLPVQVWVHPVYLYVSEVDGKGIGLYLDQFLAITLVLTVNGGMCDGSCTGGWSSYSDFVPHPP